MARTLAIRCRTTTAADRGHNPTRSESRHHASLTLYALEVKRSPRDVNIERSPSRGSRHQRETPSASARRRPGPRGREPRVRGGRPPARRLRRRRPPAPWRPRRSSLRPQWTPFPWTTGSPPSPGRKAGSTSSGSTRTDRRPPGVRDGPGRPGVARRELASAPAATAWAVDQLQVFAIFPDGQLWNRYWDGIAGIRGSRSAASSPGRRPPPRGAPTGSTSSRRAATDDLASLVGRHPLGRLGATPALTARVSPP